MIVYGDPSYEADLHALAAELRHHASIAKSLPDGWDRLSTTRNLLVRAGQLEQALEDAAPSHAALSSVRHATDLAAKAFASDLDSIHGQSNPAQDLRAPDPIRQLTDLLDDIRSTPDVALNVKVPEGFAFYTLYPEQYCAAATQWCDQHAQSIAAARVLVVGVRSIGTSLSALVAALLASRGFDASRLTVRPTGHPFDRRATLPDDVGPSRFTHALVVDEGPGISGSSMAAVAQACEDDAHVPPDHLAFLPGHAHEPGHAASATVRERWNRTKRYVVPLADLRWGDRALPDLLAATTERLLGSPVTGVEDLSAGQWRRRVYPFDHEFPTVCAPFERTKYLITTAAGSLFWKFAGLTGHAEHDFARLTSLAQNGWTPPPLAIEHGFLATRWTPMNGPLTTDDASDAGVSNALARYVIDAAGPPLSPDEQRQSLARLRDMLHWNARESLGDAAADRANKWSDWMAARPHSHPVARYGDGRLAPHEWLSAPDGRPIKTDCTGHDRDHTIVGPQPVAWDVAGALVEWQLDSLPLPASAPLDPAEVPFYRAAYAAFRFGQCTLCASFLAPGDPDRVRLLDAAARYRAELERSLAQAP
jgi:hypothetical protein